MKYRVLGRSGLKVSALGLGTQTFGQPEWGTDAPEAERIVGRFLDAGGNLIDTADVYGDGDAERIVGRAIRGRRESVVLATKVAGPTGPGVNEIGLARKHVRAAIESSLRRLDTDHVDLYQLHGFDPTTPIDETLRALDDAATAGKILHVGCSNWAAWQIMRALGIADRLGTARMVAVQMQYSPTCRHAEREHLPLARAEALAFLCWSPLAAGLLAGRIGADGAPSPGTRAARDPRFAADFVPPGARAVADEIVRIAAACGHTASQVALHWIATQPGVTAPIVGVRTEAQLEENLGALAVRLDDEMRQRLEIVSALPRAHPYDLHLAMDDVIRSLGIDR